MTRAFFFFDYIKVQMFRYRVTYKGNPKSKIKIKSQLDLDGKMGTPEVI